MNHIPGQNRNALSVSVNKYVARIIIAVSEVKTGSGSTYYNVQNTSVNLSGDLVSLLQFYPNRLPRDAEMEDLQDNGVKRRKEVVWRSLELPTCLGAVHCKNVSWL